MSQFLVSVGRAGESMANFLPEMRLQGIMELVFVILDWIVFAGTSCRGNWQLFSEEILNEVVEVVIEGIVVDSGPKIKLILHLREGEDNVFYNLSNIISNENHILAYFATTSKCQHT